MLATAEDVLYLETHVIPSLKGSYDLGDLPEFGENHHQLILWRRERARARNCAVRMALEAYVAARREKTDVESACQAEAQADLILEHIGQLVRLPSTTISRAAARDSGCIWQPVRCAMS
jgi:hypothetical protein